MKPRLLDLFSGAGGCGMGYSQAGFEVVGVDIKNQPRYPFEFHQADALEYCEEHWREFDAIHASPPCQAYSAMFNPKTGRGKHADLVAETRRILTLAGKPFVIENVPGAPLDAGILLCGTMFGLATECGADLLRHRYFETNWFAGFVMECNHGSGRTLAVCGQGAALGGTRRTIGVYGHNTPTRRKGLRETFSVDQARTAMGIPWMSRDELSQAIPPAYTKWIGERLLAYMEHSK